MATVEECQGALDSLAARLAAVGPETRTRASSDRTLSLTLPDLASVFRARVADGLLVDIECTPAGVDKPRAQIRLQCASDDLLALTEGSLGPAGAWASGRLRVEANPLDLVRLRSLF